MKKSLSLLLCLILLFGLLPLAAPARADSEGDWEYTAYSWNDYATITKYNGTGGKVTIPSTLGGKPVTEIGYSAFYGCTGLTGVTIPNSVTSIGVWAFYNCSGLSSVIIPNSVTSIGDFAFNGCSNLTSVTFGSSVTDIGNSTFSGCSRLTSVTIPNSVSSIGDGVFENCTGLTSVTIPNSVSSIGKWAFYGCTGLTRVNISDLAAWCAIEFSGSGANPLVSAHVLYLNGKVLTELTIPVGVKRVSSYAFSGCSALRSVTIPSGITTIGDSAFFNCTGLTSVTIPNSVTSLGESAFESCTGLTSVTIPSSVTSIGSSVFCNCYSLTSLTIPNSVRSIGERAFYGCSGLTNMTIPGSVTSIGDYAFSGCSSLSSLDISGNRVSFGKFLFSSCKRLTSAGPLGSGCDLQCTIPDIIPDNAFSYCSNLLAVVIPATVNEIRQDAFSGCSKLKQVYYGGTEAQWEELLILGGNDPLQNAELHCGYKIGDPIIVSSGSCGDNLNWTLDQKGKLIVSGSGTIRSNAFRDQTNILSVVLETGVIEIGEWAFIGCTGLTRVTIPNSVTLIGYSAFNGCIGLTSVTIPNSVTNINYYAFYGCTGLSSVTIPRDIIYISESAFNGCTGLADVYYGGTEENWGEIHIGSDNEPLISAAIHYNYPVPELSGATAIPGQITVTWNAVPGASKYAVYRKTAGGSWTLLTTSATGSSYVDKSAELVPGTVYYYTVKSLVNGTWSGYDNKGVSVTAASTTPVLVGAAASVGQITVTWNAVNGASKYAVYRKVAGGSWTLLTTSATGTSYVDKSAELVPGTVYYYTVKSLVNGTWSGYDNKGVSAAAASTTPVLVGATASAGQITVQWNAVNGASKYAVYRKTAGGNWTLLTTSATGNSYVDKSSELKVGTTYYYTVKSLVNGTWSGYDNKGVSAAAASTTPVLVGATASAGQITVQWNAVNGASKYAVYRKTASGSWTLLTTSVTGTSYVDKSTDLVAGTVYYYTVKSLVNGTWSGYDSKGVSATAVASSSASTTPVLVSATASAGQITVKWNAVANATKYAVYRKTASGNWTLLTTSVTGTSYVDKSTELVPGTVYYYTVKALVDGTWSGYDSKGVSATTAPILKSAAATSGQITVQWNAVSGASKYAVYRKTQGGSWTLLTTSVIGTSYTDKSSDLKAGTTYSYTVKALVSGSWSGYDASGVSATAK